MLKPIALLVLALTLGACGGDEKCCKYCDTGKACGDTCISASDTCHVGDGCACN